MEDNRLIRRFDTCHSPNLTLLVECHGYIIANTGNGKYRSFRIADGHMSDEFRACFYRFTYCGNGILSYWGGSVDLNTGASISTAYLSVDASSGVSIQSTIVSTDATFPSTMLHTLPEILDYGIVLANDDENVAHVIKLY